MAFLSNLLNRPEYIHAAINHFPLIGLFVALLVLAIGLAARSRPILLTGLGLACLMAVSYWPVSHFGEEGYDRVLSMADEPGEAFLKYHQHLADRWAFLYYLTAGIAMAGFATSWKWPRVLVPAAVVVLLLGVGSLSAGIAIAKAGGEIRHREFRSGPPPKMPDDQSGLGPGQLTIGLSSQALARERNSRHALTGVVWTDTIGIRISRRPSGRGGGGLDTTGCALAGRQSPRAGQCLFAGMAQGSGQTE